MVLSRWSTRNGQQAVEDISLLVACSDCGFVVANAIPASHRLTNNQPICARARQGCGKPITNNQQPPVRAPLKNRMGVLFWVKIRYTRVL